MPPGQKIKQKQYCDKFIEDFRNGPHKKLSKKNTIFFKKCDSQAVSGKQGPIDFKVN